MPAAAHHSYVVLGKKPGEDTYLAAQLLPMLAAGETIDAGPPAPTVTVSPDYGDDNVEISEIALQGTRIIFRCAGGVVNQDYSVLFGFKTSAHPWRELSGTLEIRA